MAQARQREAFSIDETCRELDQSLQKLEWAVELIPQGWHPRSPDGVVASFPSDDAWSVSMNLAHLTIYEERISLPVMTALAEGRNGQGIFASIRETPLLGEAQKLAEEPTSGILPRLRHVRAQQKELVLSFDADQFNMPLTPLWGKRFGAPLHSPGWVIAKTLQHTWEHGNTILKVALFAPRHG